MFKKNALLIKRVQDDEAKEWNVDKQLDTGVLVNDIAGAAMVVIGTYFALSTLRGIITHVVVTKVGPPIIIEATKES